MTVSEFMEKHRGPLQFMAAVFAISVALKALIGPYVMKKLADKTPTIAISNIDVTPQFVALKAPATMDVQIVRRCQTQKTSVSLLSTAGGQRYFVDTNFDRIVPVAVGLHSVRFWFEFPFDANPGDYEGTMTIYRSGCVGGDPEDPYEIKLWNARILKLNTSRRGREQDR